MLLNGGFFEARTLAEEGVGKQARECVSHLADGPHGVGMNSFAECCRSQYPASKRGNEMLQAHRSIQLTVGGFAVNWLALGYETSLT